MGKLTYFVARHIPDRIRNEPRNVGVIVTDGSRVVARFVGETSCEGDLDLRRVSSSLVVDRGLYAEWHRAWRRLLAADPDALPMPRVTLWANGTAPETAASTEALHPHIAALLATSSPSFLVQPGGDWYVDVGEQQEADVARLTDDIYRRLVDHTAAALAAQETALTVAPSLRLPVARSVELGQAIADAFAKRNILEGAGTRGLFAAYPIRLDQPVRGSNPVPHTPQFVQENGYDYVIEHVDFDVAAAELAREHAAYASYMLTDICKHNARAKPITVVNRVAAAEARRAAGGAAEAVVEAQEYGLAVIAENELRVVHWDDQRERTLFLDEREAVARG